jgi:hypothetical protein
MLTHLSALHTPAVKKINAVFGFEITNAEGKKHAWFIDCKVCLCV